MILELLFRSIENPSTPLSAAGDDPEVWNALTGDRTSDAGTRVTRATALGYSPFWRGVNLIANGIAKLPLWCYRRLPDGGKERAADHPAYVLTRRRPNSYMTAFQFKQTIQGHALTEGNGYSFIVRDRYAAPMELLPLDPTRTWPLRENGRLWYVHELPGGELRRLQPANVIHIRGLGYDGLIGYNVLDYATQTIGGAIAVRKFGALYFRQGTAAEVVLEHPAELKPETRNRIRADWERMHQGLTKAHRTILLEEGLKATVLSTDARKAQLLESRKFDIREVANVLNIPPHKLGDDSRTGYASLEQENQSFLDETLDAWLTTWEEEVTEKLLTAEQKRTDSHFFEFVRQALLRTDLAARYNGYNLALTGGWMNRDEVRSRENLNPMPDGTGQLFYLPANMTILDADGKAKKQPLNDARQDAIEQIARSTLKRLLHRLNIQASRCKDAGRLESFAQNELARHHDVITAALTPVIRAMQSIPVRQAATTADHTSNEILAHYAEKMTTVAHAVDFAHAMATAISDMERNWPDAWVIKWSNEDGTPNN